MWMKNKEVSFYWFHAFLRINKATNLLFYIVRWNLYANTRRRKLYQPFISAYFARGERWNSIESCLFKSIPNFWVKFLYVWEEFVQQRQVWRSVNKAVTSYEIRRLQDLDIKHLLKKTHSKFLYSYTYNSSDQLQLRAVWPNF